MGKYSNGRYEEEDTVNELCNMILLLSIKLAEPEKAVDYYFKHARNFEKEITLYCVLHLLGLMDENELWIKAYEYGIKKKD